MILLRIMIECNGTLIFGLLSRYATDIIYNYSSIPTYKMIYWVYRRPVVTYDPYLNCSYASISKSYHVLRLIEKFYKQWKIVDLFATESSLPQKSARSESSGSISIYQCCVISINCFRYNVKKPFINQLLSRIVKATDHSRHLVSLQISTRAIMSLDLR